MPVAHTLQVPPSAFPVLPPLSADPLPQGHDEVVRDVSWHPHEPVLASVAWDGRVVRWEADQDGDVDDLNLGTRSDHPGSEHDDLDYAEPASDESGPESSDSDRDYAEPVDPQGGASEGGSEGGYYSS